jgi:hypothetical protein
MSASRRIRHPVGILVGCALIALTSALVVLLPKSARRDAPYRAFSPSSYWNTPLPLDAPVDTNSENIIAFIKEHSTTDFVHFGGATPEGTWGNPIYWAKRGNPSYEIRNTCSFEPPPEFASVRIPRGARPDPSSDSAMTVYDVAKGHVYAFHWTNYDKASDTWSACGGAVYYLNSNGLHGTLRRSDEPRNDGHRGVPPPAFAVRYDEVQFGEINHVLKIGVTATKCAHVFPMVRDECGTTATHAPPEGTRIRIKPSIDLSLLGLSAPELVVARALQEYGAVIGDQGGGPVSLKLENTVAEGRGQLWDGVLTSDSLAAIPLDGYEVIELGYDPTRPNLSTPIPVESPQ